MKQVIKFTAQWCAPCRAIAPMLAQVKKELEGTVELIEYDVDEDKQETAQYGVTGVPTILFLKDGEVVGKHVGALTKSSLLQKIESM